MQSQNGLPFERPILEILEKIEELKSLSEATGMDLNGEVRPLEERCAHLTREIFSQPHSVGAVQIARHKLRPLSTDYVELLCDDFMELHGDRASATTRRSCAALARIDGRADHDHRPSQGPRHCNEAPLQLRLRPSRGLPQGAAQDESPRSSGCRS
jgi:acetyl-CoA carboxylase alpha subunit